MILLSHQFFVVKKYIFLLSVYSLLCASANAQTCALRLSGHVHSTATHENLANATVFLKQGEKSIITDTRGDFRFEKLCMGTYTLLITHASFDSIQHTI